MALIKVKNNGQTILFIESLGAIIRPYKRPMDYILVEEEKAKLDAQFVKCVLSGTISAYSLDGKEWGEIKKEVEETFKEDKKNKKIKKILGRKKIESEVVEEKTKKEKIKQFEDEEPKNSKPVVMSGKNAHRVNFTKNSDVQLPEFLNEDEIQNIDDEEKTGDIEPDDIVLT